MKRNRKQHVSIHGAASIANPKIPNFKQSIAAARRDLAKKTHIKSVTTSSSSPPPQRNRDTHFGEQREGHVDSALRRGSLVAFGLDGNPVGHHDHPSRQGRSAVQRRQSVTEQLGIKRVDPKTLQKIPERMPEPRMPPGPPVERTSRPTNSMDIARNFPKVFSFCPWNHLMILLLA